MATQSNALSEPAAALAGLQARLRDAEAKVRELSAALEEKSAEVELLHEVAAGVAAATSAEEMLDYIAETAIRVSNTDSASIYVLDYVKGELILRSLKDSPHGVTGKLKPKIGEWINGWE